MPEFKNTPRGDLVTSTTVQRFVELFDNDLGLRRMFLSRFEDSLKEIKGEERRRLIELTVKTRFLPHPSLMEKMTEAREIMKGHSPLHKFFEDYQLIWDAIKRRVNECELNFKGLIKSCEQKNLLSEVYISLCPEVCFFEMSSKPVTRCKICKRETIVFPFYKVADGLLEAWRDNAFFEAWAFSLLKRNKIPCRTNLIVRDVLDLGEIDILIEDERRKSIIEVTKGGEVALLARELLAWDYMLDGVYKLILLHTKRLPRLKEIETFQNKVLILDNAYGDKKFPEKFLTSVTKK